METSSVRIVDRNWIGVEIMNATSEPKMIKLGKLNTDVFRIINTGTYWGEVGDVQEDVCEDCMDIFEEILCDTACEYMNEALTELFEDICKVDVKHPSFWKPQWYNYTDNCVEFEFEIEEKFFTEVATKYIEDNEFLKYLKEKYYSYSGYINKMPNTKEKFAECVANKSWEPVVQIVDYMYHLEEQKGIYNRRAYQNDFLYDVREACDNECILEYDEDYEGDE